jgi:hypothetical protein
MILRFMCSPVPVVSALGSTRDLAFARSARPQPTRNQNQTRKARAIRVEFLKTACSLRATTENVPGRCANSPRRGTGDRSSNAD